MLRNASNIVLVGTPQTEHTPLALGVVDSHAIEIFGTLSSAMHTDWYTTHGGKSQDASMACIASTIA